MQYQKTYYNFLLTKRKGTSNKFCLRNIFIPMILILHHSKKEQALYFVLEKFEPKKFLNPKRNKQINLT